ncbi:MAG: hypothetical protein C4520_13640 [Candidatus Abyssobacteria bacterium SURF_5]|uniref:Doubled CXXCH motif domain-containing protein n=1 Tax=Abyssobacteria bacterium (strain SURF_5) TaxID=2093360 RepID=A0A3A4NK19_ABYX5|nr:MAG: hypothetical protein C4520_13640 [Candidatus Abyssubacteria bacterium SURF_5]
MKVTTAQFLLIPLLACLAAVAWAAKVAGTAVAATEEIHLLKPLNYSYKEGSPTFEWSPGSDDRFKIEYSFDPNFGRILWRTPLLSTPSYKVAASEWDRLPAERRVYWRVKGGSSTDGSGAIHTSAEVWSFWKQGSEPNDGDNVTSPPDPESFAGMNLIALHNSQSPQYMSTCVACHGSMKYETSLDPDVDGIHQEMLEEIPGSTNNEKCLHCHRTVDLLEHSASKLRRQVNPDLCAACHGPGGVEDGFYAE